MAVKNLLISTSLDLVTGQQELAKLLGVSQSSISGYLTGRRPVPEALVTRLHELFPQLEGISEEHSTQIPSLQCPLTDEELIFHEILHESASGSVQLLCECPSCNAIHVLVAQANAPLEWEL